jgi:hypothetical protein
MPGATPLRLQGMIRGRCKTGRPPLDPAYDALQRAIADAEGPLAGVSAVDVRKSTINWCRVDQRPRGGF